MKKDIIFENKRKKERERKIYNVQNKSKKYFFRIFTK